MGRSQETFNKKEVRTKKEKKRKEKAQKRLARKDNPKKGGLDDMIAYVDEYGRISSTPPDSTRKEKIKAEDIAVSVPRRENTGRPDPIRRGVVTFFNDSKGFGFIRDTETQESVFFHINNLEEHIAENNLVSFEILPGPKGPTAKNVRLIK
jgi:cold shock CspA family protein